jgi:hypothetical protein
MMAVPLHSAQNARVGQGDAALSHHFDEISIAEPKRQVPAQAQFNGFRIESATPIDWISRDNHGHSAFAQKAEFWAPPSMHQNPNMPPR